MAKGNYGDWFKDAAYSTGNYVEGTPNNTKGTFATLLDNVAGGAEGVIGGGLDYLGSGLKSLDQAGRESSYVDSIKNSNSGPLGNAGDWLINNGEYLNNKAAKNFAESGTLDKYNDMSLLERALSLDYLTDRRGLLADAGQMVGSAIPFMAASAAAPFGGAGAAAARATGSLAGRVGLNRIGTAIASKAGQSAGAAAAKWGLGTGPLEAAVNAGGIYQDLKEQGLSDDEIYRRMNSMIQDELPMDVVTQGIVGPILEGKGFRPIFKRGGKVGKVASYGTNVIGSGLSEYKQEQTQQAAQNKWSGKPYGTFFNPTEDEEQAGRAAFFGSLPLGIFGAGHTAYRDYKRRLARMNGANANQSENVDEESIYTDNDNGVANDKENFFNAVEAQESGGNSNAVSSAGARGVYQIMPENWEAWSKEAGLAGADMNDDEAYRQVGRFKMGQYYDQYGPEGALVAWYSGPNNAARWVAGEATDQNGKAWDAPQSNGPSIAEYVNSAMGKFQPQQQAPAFAIPDTAEYTVSNEVSNPNLTELTEQKLRWLDSQYYNQYGRHFYITSMARNGNGDSWHDSAQAFDTADDFLEGNSEARDWLINKAKEVGLYGLDEYSTPSAHATGGHLHFSDHGEAITGNAQVSDGKVPQIDISQYQITPEQAQQNFESAQALINNDQVSPEQEQAVMAMAEDLMNTPYSDNVDEDVAHANAIQEAIDNGDLKAIFAMHPQETTNAMLAGKKPQPKRAPATPNIAINDSAIQQAKAQQQVQSQALTNQFAQAVDKITNLAAQGKIGEAAEIARNNGLNNTMVNLLAHATTQSTGDIQSAIMNGIQLDMPTVFPASPTGRGLAENIQNNNQQRPMAVSEQVANMAENNPQSAANFAMQRNMPLTANTIMQSAMNGQPVDSNLLNAAIKQDYNNNWLQANSRMQNAGLVMPNTTPNAGIIVPNGQVANTTNFDFKKRLSEVEKISRDDSRALGKEHIEEMEANNIPIKDNLRQDLENGVPKAIVSAEKKIAKADSDEADNNTNIVNEVAETSHAPEQSESNKKAANEGGYELADGYKTESGKPLSEADKNEFIVKPDGSKDFGKISQEISKAVKEQSGIDLKTGKIRLRVGDESQGLIHAKKHEQQAKDDGYNSIEDMIADVASNFDEIYMRDSNNENGNVTYSLIKRGDKAKGKMNGIAPVYFEMQGDGNGNYYIVVSVMPMGDKNLKRNIIKKDHLIYSSPGLGAATVSNVSAVSRVNHNVGADTHGGYPTSDKSSSLVTSSVAQDEKADNTKTEATGKKIVGKSGKTATVITDSGKELNVTYKLVPASRVVTSHTADGLSVNKKYPQELQPRDRQRVAMRQQITKMANELRPEDLAEGRNLNQGAPIVREDGVVLNGNGRAIAIQTAQNGKKESAKKYKMYLVEHAEEFGFKPEDVKGMKAPMLVRMVENIDESATQDIINSTTGGSRLGASEQAKVDAKKIGLIELEAYVPNDKGDLTTAANRDFLQGIMNKIIGNDDMNAYLDEHGNINADGIQRIKRALFQAAYGNDELIAKMAESTDDAIKNVTNALTNVAPVIARVNAKMEHGEAHKHDLAKNIADAVNRYNHLRQTGEPLEHYLSQQSMFSEYVDTPEVVDILKALDKYKRSANKLSQFFSRVGEIIEAQGNPKEESLFESVQPLNLKQIINTAYNEVENGGKGKNLFDMEPAEQSEINKKAADEGGTVEVTGDEFGEYSTIDELRDKAKAYYKEHLQGTSVNNPILGKVNLAEDKVDFTGRGIKKAISTSGKKNKLLLIKHLPKLIRNATEVDAKENVKNKREAKQYTYLHTEAVIDGKTEPVTITIFTDVNGNRYYNHILGNEEHTKKELPVYPAQASKEGDGIPTMQQLSNESVSQDKKSDNSQTEGAREEVGRWLDSCIIDEKSNETLHERSLRLRVNRFIENIRSSLIRASKARSNSDFGITVHGVYDEYVNAPSGMKPKEIREVETARVGDIYERASREWNKYYQAYKAKKKASKNEAKTNHFDITDYTHTKTGEVFNAAKITDKVDRDTYAKIKDIAIKHGGRYNRFAKRFFFKDTGAEGRDAFVAEVKRDVFGETVEQKITPAVSQSEAVVKSKEQAHSNEAKNNSARADEDDYHGFLDDKTPSEIAKIKEVLSAKTDPFGGSKGYVTSKHIMETLAKSSAKGEVNGNNYYINGNKVKKAAYEYFDYLRKLANGSEANGDKGNYQKAYDALLEVGKEVSAMQETNKIPARSKIDNALAIYTDNNVIDARKAEQLKGLRNEIIKEYEKNLADINKTEAEPVKEEAKTESKNDSIFGEYNEDELYKALGIEAVDDTASETLSQEVPKGIEGTEEERERLRAEIRKELSKISANPMFNPRLYTLSAKYVFSYIKSGINDIKKLVTTLKAEFGDDFANDWAPAVIETVRTYPKGVPFNETHVMAMTKAVGSLYESGTTDLKIITERITARMPEATKKQFAPVVEASYNGIKKFFANKQEAENNGLQQGKSGDVDGGHQSVAPGESEAVDNHEARAVSKRNGREGGAVSRTDEAENTEGLGTGRVSAGRNVAETAGPRASAGGDKQAVPLTEAQAKPSATETPGHDYEIKGTSTADKAKPEVRFKQNVQAIKLLKQLLAADRMPTPAEQKVLAAYNGWGGLKNAFIEGSKQNKELTELLTAEEYEAARASTLDAFYTAPSIVRAIWKGVSRLGFKGGRILDPAMGVGNFYGCMPRDMMKHSKLHGVEMDVLSSQFAKMLYPSAVVENKPFQSSKVADNFFDLVITNVPFSQAKAGGYMIHNYYFANGIDKVRPGGLMVYITSQGSLTGATDAAKMRQYIAGRADVIGAFKLPEGTFKESGTDVAADVIIIQKRDKDNKTSDYAQSAQSVNKMQVQQGYARYYVSINEYFENHPEHILGEVSAIRDQYGNEVLSVTNKTGEDVGKLLDKAMASLPKDIYTPINRNNSKAHNTVAATKRAQAEAKTKDREYYIKDSKLYQNENGEAKPITGKNAQLISDYVGIKSTLNSLFQAQRDPNASDGVIDRLRTKLNQQYDNFVKKYGYLNEPKVAAKYADDPSAGTVMALEKITFTGQGRKRSIEKCDKADIFTQRTIMPIKEVTSVDNPTDALLASLNNSGSIDFDYMAKLLNSTPDKVAQSLMQSGMIFKNPATEGYETRDEYLSGNVREKLAQAENAAADDSSYKRNVDELKKVQPQDLVSDEIVVNLGAPWIPASDIQDFAKHCIKNGNIRVSYVPGIARWTVTGYGGSAKFNTNGMEFKDMLEHVLNNKSIEIYTGRGDERKLNQQLTDAANAMADNVRDEFKRWLWSDKARTDRLVKYYNTNYNNSVLRQYNGAHLTFPGMNANIHMKPHQKNIVWRILQSGNTLIAHCVGAGKTFEMQATGMEMRRLGLANKPLYCVPNNVVEQFAREFRQLYPNAKLLVIKSGKDLPTVRRPKVTVTEDGRKKVVPIDLNDMSKAERDKLIKDRAERNRALARIQTEDWDGIIMSHNMFERLPLSPETIANFTRDELRKLEETIRLSKNDGQLDNRTLKSLEARKETLKTKIEEMLNMDLRDIGIPFEEIGIDQIFVDEADLFKNLYYATSIGGVSGLTNSNANRSTDMYIKTQYLTSQHDGHGVVFATGTPISNTMAEMYTMMKYLDLRGLKEHGVELFDSWIRTFAEIGTGIERKPSGDGFRTVNKVKNFINMAELTKMFRKFTDVKRQEDLDLKIPTLKGGKPTVVSLEADEKIVDYIRNVVPKRVQNMKQSAFKKEKGADNMLKLTGDLRKMALSNAKIEACADRIVEVFNTTNDVKGAQLVFCDLGIPKAENEKATSDSDSNVFTDDTESENASVYTKLIETLKRKGIPEEQIAFVQQAKTKDEQAELFQKVDRGDLRILIGSTTRMGAGTNCQHHLVALHDLDAPWRPRDLEQRHGRILRQGNENSEVEIFNYVIKDSFDANMWEKLKNKASIIAQAMSENDGARVVEDVDMVALSYAEIEGAATGNPLIKEQLDLNNEVAKYTNASTQHSRKISQAERDMVEIPEKIQKIKAQAEKVQKDIDEHVDTRGEKFAIELNGKKYTKRADAEEALKAIVKKLDNVPKEIGNIGGYKIKGFISDLVPTVQLVKNWSYKTNTVSVKGIENVANDAPAKAKAQYDSELALANEDLETATEIAKQPNPYKEKLQQLQTRLREVNRKIEQLLVDGGKKENDQVEESQPHYSASEAREKKAQAIENLRNDIAEALPNAKNVRDEGSSVYFTMPNGAEVEIHIADSLNVSGVAATKARQAHGISDGISIKINGMERTIGSKAVIQLSKIGDEGSVHHEVFHAVWDMVLTPKEKQAITKAYETEAKRKGKDVVEVAADKYRDWFMAKTKGETKDANGKPFKFGLLWRKIREAVEKLRSVIAGSEEVNRIFRDIETGKMWERSIDNEQSVNDNIANKVFDRYLNDGIKKMVKESVEKEISDHVNLADMSDPVARDAARDRLPYIRSMLVWFNQLRAQKAKQEYIDRYATKIEYARRCFDNDYRIRREAIRGIDDNSRQKQNGGSSNEVNAQSYVGGSISNSRRSTIGVSNNVSNEKSGARKHFEKLYNEEKSRSSKSGFYSAQNLFSLQDLTERDNEYLSLVDEYNSDTTDEAKAAAHEKLTKMVQQAAENAGCANAVPEQTRAYTTRSTKPPTKTKKVYKVFTVDESGRPSALFVSSKDTLPQNVWLDANDTFAFTDSKNGRKYIPSTKNPNTKGGATGEAHRTENISDEELAKLEELGYIKRNKQGQYPKTITGLAYRPGWHAGDLPFFPQGGKQGDGTTNYKNIHRYNQVVFECEIAYDTDYTKSGTNSKGQIVYTDMQEMPVNGGYKFATNPMTSQNDLGSWYISGSLKIGRALTEEECNKILAKNGFKPQEWQAYGTGNDFVIGKLDLAKLGYTGEEFDAARKTLAPITYDDEGNVIPLSQRFNPEIDDIRFSISEMQTESEPAGSLDRMRRSINNLAGVKTESNVEVREGKQGNANDNLNMLDMWVKSVRQVARKNLIVKQFYKAARKAYSEQEHLRSHFGEAMKRFNKYVKDKDDLADVAKVLWVGDMEGKSYSVKELKEAGLSDNGIRAYKLVRERLEEAYNLINDARMQVKTRSKLMPAIALDEFMQSHFLKEKDIVDTRKRGNSILVTYKGAKVTEHTEDMTKEAFKNLQSEVKDGNVYIYDTEEFTTSDGTEMVAVHYSERIKPVSHLEGYMPHFFHKFMVYQKITDSDGNTHNVTIGSGRSLKEAADIANKVAKENPDNEYFIRPHGFEDGEEYNNVVVGDRDFAKMTNQIAKHTEMTVAEANKFLHDKAGVSLKGRHRHLGNLMKRKGAEGFEQDVQWALEHYFNVSARYVAMEHWKPNAISMYERYFGAFDAEPKTDLARYVKNHINDMNGVPSRFEKLLNRTLEKTALGKRISDYYNGRPALALSSSVSSFNAITKLGLGNFASAAINFMQLINVATALNSYKWAMQGLRRALKPTEMDRKIIEASGIMDEISMADNNGGYSKNRDSGRARGMVGTVKRLSEKTMLPFTWADTIMRKAAILGGYYQGIEEKGMKPKSGETISKRALNYAKDINFDANFDYSTAATPGAMRAGSVLTQQLFQFQKYPIMQFEFMWNNVVHAKDNAQRARFLVPYLLLAGICGSIPFGDLLNEFFSFLAGLFSGKDVNLGEACRAEMMKWAGNDEASRKLVNFIQYGVPGLFNVDISGRVGMAGSFSGKFYGNAPESTGGVIASALGGPLLSTIVNTSTQLRQGNPVEAIKAISPALGNMLQAAYGETHTTGHRVATVYEDGWSRFMHGLGFRSADESNTAFINNQLYNLRQSTGDKKKDAMNAYRENKTAENKRAMEELGITKKQYDKYEREADMSSKERALQESKSKKKKVETENTREAKALKDFMR